MIVWFVNQQELGFEKAHIGNNLNELEDASPCQINRNTFTSCLRKPHIYKEIFLCVVLSINFALANNIPQNIFNFKNLI